MACDASREEEELTREKHEALRAVTTCLVERL